ncbi:MAG: hypothetical protein C5B53_06110 [Candidatus Melainabacteria bacterium]|nr:MAG: hypothetical protein C5B53_06110 [Candidatus Melainabacteria bacterium]
MAGEIDDSGAQFTGFWSGEIIPPKHGEQKLWTLVQWFTTSSHAETWRQSATRAAVLSERASFIRKEALAFLQPKLPCFGTFSRIQQSALIRNRIELTRSFFWSLQPSQN